MSVKLANWDTCKLVQITSLRQNNMRIHVERTPNRLLGFRMLHDQTRQQEHWGAWGVPRLRTSSNHRLRAVGIQKERVLWTRSGWRMPHAWTGQRGRTWWRPWFGRAWLVWTHSTPGTRQHRRVLPHIPNISLSLKPPGGDQTECLQRVTAQPWHMSAKNGLRNIGKGKGGTICCVYACIEIGMEEYWGGGEIYLRFVLCS